MATTDTRATQQGHDLYDVDYRMDGVWCGCGAHEDDRIHDPVVKVTHVVVGQGCYGNGSSLEQAKAAFKRAGGRLGGWHLIVEFPPECTYLGISGMGSMKWRYETEERVQPIQTEVPARKR